MEETQAKTIVRILLILCALGLWTMDPGALDSCTTLRHTVMPWVTCLQGLHPAGPFICSGPGLLRHGWLSTDGIQEALC